MKSIRQQQGVRQWQLDRHQSVPVSSYVQQVWFFVARCLHRPRLRRRVRRRGTRWQVPRCLPHQTTPTSSAGGNWRVDTSAVDTTVLCRPCNRHLPQTRRNVIMDFENDDPFVSNFDLLVSTDSYHVLQITAIRHFLCERYIFHILLYRIVFLNLSTKSVVRSINQARTKPYHHSTRVVLIRTTEKHCMWLHVLL